MFLTEDFLFKALLMLEGIKKPLLFSKILKVLTMQVGNKIMFTELAQLVGSNKNTVKKNIDMLEKIFVVFILSSLAEISEMS